MTEKHKANRRFYAWRGIGFFLLLVALCMVTGIVSATTYTAADQNANGQYQIVYTVNPDNSQTFKAAGVANGAMTVSDPPPTTGQSTSQDVDMSGQYGYALIAAQDSSGNQADSETWLYNGDAEIQQCAGIAQSGGSSTSQNLYSDHSVPYTGAYASQIVSSCNFSSIVADTDSQTVDDSAADVLAEATSSGSSSPSFFVTQSASAFSPVGVPCAVQSYSIPVSRYNIGAYASQSGAIFGADTAHIETSATETNGLSSLVGVSANGNDNCGEFLSFIGMQSSATNSSNEYKGFGGFLPQNEVESNGGLINARGDSGSVIATSSAPNNQYATVTGDFVRNISSTNNPGLIYIDLSAEGSMTPDTVSTCADGTMGSKFLKPISLLGYDGSITAANSINGTTTSTFLPKTKWADGDAFVTMNTDGTFNSGEIKTKIS